MPTGNGKWHIGVVSDTHGLLRPQVIASLRGVDQILHAGDVGRLEVLDALRELAPTTAIRGNVDVDGVLASLPETEMVILGESRLAGYLVHSVQDLDIDPVAAGVSVVISGHSHAPSIQQRGSVMYLNPGSVGARRFKLPVSLAFITVRGDRLSAELRTLEC